ncbi:hypothetical protein [Congregibacter sp.]|uniref:hypothetical protein n=1 Tax=Congregibacter sp. TaxID=2744308 RepID=UPI003F6AA0FC
MIRYRKAILVAMTLTLVAPASYGWGQVYKVIDSENGVVFTDTPPTMGNSTDKTVEKVELNEINTAAPVESRQPASSTARSESEPEVETAVTIVSPANESTIAMGPGNFTVSASASPALGRGEGLVLLIDGVEQGQAQSSGSWFVEGALRGPHDLMVRRTTSQGKIVATSESVRIYVLRPGIGR